MIGPDDPTLDDGSESHLVPQCKAVVVTPSTVSEHESQPWASAVRRLRSPNQSGSSQEAAQPERGRRLRSPNQSGGCTARSIRSCMDKLSCTQGSELAAVCLCDCGFACAGHASAEALPLAAASPVPCTC